MDNVQPGLAGQWTV